VIAGDQPRIGPLQQEQNMKASSPIPVVPSDSPFSADSKPRTNGEQRGQLDRRTTPTTAWRALLPAGRRARNRRGDEHRRPYFVDRFSFATFLGVVMLIVASLVDAILTVHILQAGGEEVNPLMDRLLDHSVEAFVLGKYLLTVVGLPLLLIFKNHYLFGTPLRVGHLIVVAVALYGVLIGYQIMLIHQYVGW
jgi:hypothetical protein